MMTSFAFIAGLIPLVFATGAAMLSRRGVGTAVFGGMIAAVGDRHLPDPAALRRGSSGRGRRSRASASSSLRPWWRNPLAMLDSVSPAA